MLRVLSRRRGALPGALRGTSSSAAVEERTGHAHGAPPAAAAAGGGGGTGGTGETPSTPDRVAKIIAHAFHRAPKDTASALMKELTELDKIHLVLALQRSTSKAKLQSQETHYVEDLMKQVKQQSHQQHNKLTRQQIHNAVIYQRMLQKFSSVSEDPPTWRQLTAVGLASGLPFVVFGILDNGIMLVAGEQIDHLFGAKMGLSVLASAGLGNMVADVVGVSATHTIQENMKRITFARPPRLSMLQQQAVPYKAAQFAGAALGVAVGCLIGMTPLAFMEPGFFVSAAEGIDQAAEAAAAAVSAVQEAAGGAAAGASDAAPAAAALQSAAAAGGKVT